MKRLGLCGCLGVAAVAAIGALCDGCRSESPPEEALPEDGRREGWYTVVFDKDDFYPPLRGYRSSPKTNRVASLTYPFGGKVSFNAYLRTGPQEENPTIVITKGDEHKRSDDQYTYHLLYMVVNGELKYDYEHAIYLDDRFM